MGYQTDLNPLQSNQSSHGTNIPTSRHTRNPSYFDLQLGKSFENGSRVKATLDNDGYTPHRDGFSKPKTIEELALRDLRIRDLYLEVPAGEARIWAGARRFEFEDVRVFDFLNPFNINGLGFGGSLVGTTLVLSVTDRSVVQTLGAADDGETRPEGDADDVTVPLKDVTFLARHELKLGDQRAIKPMFSITQYGSAPENDQAPQTEIEGATAFKIGGVYSSWSNSHSANIGVWFESNPLDRSGNPSGTDTAVGIMASNTYEFASFGILTGLYLRYDSFKNSRDQYKIAGNKKSLVKEDGDKTTNNLLSASVGVQPVYYVTDHLHLALDLNYAGASKKIAQPGEDTSTDANALLVTPILRYAMNRNVLGTPQLYTSVTYGQYDWKAKKNAKAENTDTLFTTQTGFEVWF
jgi:maltoporin